jgi:organic hydroperoxide reductase OsmC/OhrA
MTLSQAISVSLFKDEAKIEIEWFDGGNLRINFKSGSMNDLAMDRSRVPPDNAGGEARKLLAASVAECMGSTLFFLLKWANVEFKGFRATAEAVTAKDEKGRLCVDGVNLTIDVDISKDEETLRKFERVKNLFKKGCLISRSLERGVKAKYSIVT